MPKRVLVVGAGLTRAEGERARGGTRRKLPPLNRGFFAAMRDARIGLSDLNRVHSYFSDVHAKDCYLAQWDSLEDVMVRLVSDALMPFGQEAADAFSALMRLYSRGIHDTTSWITQSRKSFLPQCIASWLRDDPDPNNISIITFNQDLEIEKALTTVQSLPEFRELGPLFVPPFSYGSRFSSLRRFGQGRVPRFETFAEEPAAYPWLLKLHGSLNWASLHKRRNPRVKQILSPGREVRWTSRRTIPAQTSLTDRGRPRHAIPLVVPPIYNKAAVMPQTILDIWELAEFPLREADEVTFAGYSCPIADIEAESLFQWSLKDNEHLSAIHIVNPDPSAVARFVEFRPQVPITYHPSAHEWIARITGVG